MEEEKKIYFKCGCSKAVIRIAASTEEKEMFSRVADNQDLLNEWNDEYIKISYDEFTQNHLTLSKNELDGHFIEILALMAPSKENVQLIINMFNILIKENLVTKAFEKDDRRTSAIFADILSPKNWKKGVFKIDFLSTGDYDGLLPYLYEQKRMEEFNLLLNTIEPVFNALTESVYKGWLKDYKSKLSL